MYRKTTSAFVALALPVVLTLAACGSSGSSGSSASPSAGASAAADAGSLTIGSADFTESALLADIYADALAAKGVKITKKLNIGERSVYVKALQDGSIDFIPEYNGSILAYLDPKATAKSTAEVTAALPAALGSKLTALTPATAQDSDTITVTKATADKYHLTSIADLTSVADKLTFGAPAAFQTRPDGIPALKSVYGVTFGNFTALSASGTVTVTSLKNGTIDGADIFSTDPSFASEGFVALADPKNMFAAQNVTPVVATAKVTPTIKDTVNAVSAKLTTAILADLDAKVGTGDPDAVAKQWLTSVGLA
ncbi:ABC transporter substrate-binding protein [Pseudofrankia inefficax]|uniref:Substrate-binding region of ABC-type glycine betaine transport system n=1 Tax=Pseudofrankia inefficax (strain DSM 45817 / CECT 9037 / DDB 130130 / EuI1c) TaxID=298654 RepID=E3J3I9_PSEI1|nr:ABC transporter substrate-binding protein [Pseudofrankia inefficax]ADP78191.1 Substrate-binding region of ABC-type glycine betaine transport system [Pseudofrankia inefficax]